MPRVLPHEKPLSPPHRDLPAEPVEGHEELERLVSAGFQLQARKGGAPPPGTVPVTTRREEGIPPRVIQVSRSEPGAERVRRTPRAVVLEQLQGYRRERSGSRVPGYRPHPRPVYKRRIFGTGRLSVFRG